MPPRLLDFSPRYNIAPTQNQWAIRRGADERLEVRPLRWGLIPSWANDSAIGPPMINARAETIAEKPAFRDALQAKRCLILADGYYEWQKNPGGKTPFRFQMTDRKPFVFAGLWDRWEKSAAPIESCTIITTQASTAAASVHNRMPVILNFDESITWLQPDSGAAELLQLLQPYPKTDLEMFSVSRAVNNVANDSAECIQPSELLTLDLF